MQFERTLLKPDYGRRPHFKTPVETENDPFYRFVCLWCGSWVEISYKILIQETLAWENSWGEAFAAQAKKLYGIGVVGKSHDGGWPSMVIANCSKCTAKYLIYAGVSEVYNSIYTVTIQGITELIDAASDDEH